MEWDRHGIRHRGGWVWVSCPTRVMERARAIVTNPEARYATGDNGCKLSMHLQLREGFGWATWQEVLRGYNEDFDNGVIEGRWSDEKKRDAFLYRFSRAAGHDLSRWFTEYWRVGASEEGLRRVAEMQLPEWMPAVGGIAAVDVTSGSSHELDLAGAALSFDGVAEIVQVRQPRNGTLRETDRGTWMYMPNAGFVGVDSFEHGVRSSTGHVYVHTVALNVGDAAPAPPDGEAGTAASPVAPRL